MSTQTAKSIVNPCTGEPVLVTGTVHIEQHEQVSKRGAIHYQTVVSSKGFRGTTADPVNPATYVTSDGQLSQFNSGSATESTYAQRQVYNRLGENGRFVNGDDFRLTLYVHTTIDANGRITSFKLIELQPEPTCN